MAEALATTQRLPSGVILAKDEIVRAVGEFFVSNVFVYLKLNLVLTNKRLAGEKRNTFLGFIPVGTEKVSYPLNNVAGVNTSTRIAPLPLIFGVLLVIGGISEGLQLGWFAVLLGLILLAGCYQAQLNVENSGGGKIKHRISVFNKASAQSFAQEINTMIAERT